MHNLLKNTLNFDNFKNIKLDLINKVNAFDSNDFHEENEVFNFLKDKKFVSDGLYFDAQGDTENTFSVKKRLKRIHDLKSYLNSIKNFRNNEKIKLNESKKENINVHERSVNFFSFSRNKNNDDIDKKQDIKNIVYLKNTLSQERRNKQGLTNKVFCKTLYKKIEKNEFEKKKYFQKFMLNISNIPENSSKKIVRITNSNRVNQKILVHHYYCKKGSLEKKNVKILEIRSKRKFSYMSFIKKHKSFIKEDKNLGISIKKFFLDNNNSNNNNQFKKNNGIPLEKKNNYLKSSLNKKESNKSTIKEVQNNMLKYDKISSYDRIKSLCERYDISNIKFPLFNNTENEDGVIKCKKKKIKSNELKKIKKCFQITKLDDTSKTSLSLKNTNLSIFRRMSTNNQYKNKKEVKRNKDIPFHFHSNNINFYETLVKKEKYIEESKNKDKYFFDKNVIQNNEMKEIKQKIQRTLISLNNIKKNNYKLKFCLEKEIIDNTIHHNELKRSICSLFNENILQRKNVEVSKNNQNKKNETNESNKNICNDNYTKVIKQRRESVDNGNNDIIENPFKGNTTLANNIKDKMDIIKGYNNSDFSGIKHTIIKEEQEGKNKISGDIKLLDNFENQRLLRIKCLTLNNKKQQNESVFIKDTAYKNSTKYNISSKIIKYNREPRYVTLEQNEDKHFFEQEKKKKKNADFNKEINILNTNKLKKKNYIYKSLFHNESLKDEKNSINSIEKINNCNFVPQEKSNILKGFQVENTYTEILNRYCLKNLKSNIKKEFENNEENSVKVGMKETYKKIECFNNNDNTYISDKEQLNEQVGKNSNYNEKKMYKKKYWWYENKQIKQLNNQKCDEGNININRIANANNFNDTLVHNKKVSNVSSNIFVNKSIDLEQLVLNKTKKERKDFALGDVKNIKKIINCEIYISEKFERIHKRNKIALNIIENYLDKRKRTYSDFPKEKNNIYLQKNSVIENLDEKKNFRFLPGLYEHYAFLLLNFRNCEVR